MDTTAQTTVRVKHVRWLRVLSAIRRLPPLRIVLLGYLSYVLLGWLLLSLPVSWQSSRVHPIDNLFTATSVMSTTGLVTISVADSYSFWGELVVLCLIQVGGIGYMTVASFVVLARHQPLSEFREQITQTTFSLPAGFSTARFLRDVGIFTAAIEIAGAVFLYPIFRDAHLPQPAWQAIFHSVSAFCTAGFSLLNDSFERFVGHPWLNLIIGCLSYLGAIGFIVMHDVMLTLTGRRPHLTLTSRIILHTTVWVSLVGWAVIFLTEPAFMKLPPVDRLMASGFQAMTAVTTVGFDTVATGQIGHAAMLVVIVLMIIGASPSGTGGGLKSTTFSALVATVLSALRGQSRVRFFGYQVPDHRLIAAYATIGLYLAALLAGTLLLLLTETADFGDLFFEAASALGTVGLSRGVTGQLTVLGKLVAVGLMFVGRVGPVTFGLALLSRRPRHPGQEDLAV